MNQEDETQRDSARQQADSHDPPKQLPNDIDIEGGIPYELRIGVTGHRVLEDPDEVHEAIQNVIDDLVRILTGASRDPHGAHGSPQSPVQLFDRFLAHCLSIGTRLICPVVNTALRVSKSPDRWLWPVVPVSPTKPTLDQQTPLKLTGISCLAIGSDQIFIDVIHQVLSGSPRPGLVPAQRRNRYVEAVLPFPQQEYGKNYAAEDLTQFRKLLALDRGKYQTQAEPTVAYPAFPSDGRGGTLDREDAYRVAGHYMVDTSEIIIAVWNPDQKEETGGTGETARYAIGRGKTVIWIDPRSLKRPPVVLRAADPDSEHESQTIGRWERLDIDAPNGLTAFKLPQRAKALSPNFHRLAAYNRDGAIKQFELDRTLSTERVKFAKRAVGKLPESVQKAIAEHILPHLVRADLLSCRYRDLRAVTAWLWPAMAAVAVTLIAFQIFFLPNQYWIAWIELSLLVICAIAYRVSLYDAWHDKWRNDRRLAEGLRSVLHSTSAMSDDWIDNDDESSNKTNHAGVQHPLPFYGAEQSWLVGTIKRIVRKERMRYAADIDWNRDLGGIKNFLADEWILGQAEYHRKNAKRHHGQAKRYKYLRLSIIGLIVVVTILHATGVGHGHDAHDSDHAGSRFAQIALWIALLTGVLPAWGAMIHALSTSDDHERLAERSGRMVPLLNGLAERIRAAGSRTELNTYVMEAERLFDLESQEWAESLADRRPEMNG